MKRTEKGYVFESSGRIIDASEIESGLSLGVRKEENVIQYGYDGQVYFRDEKTGEYETDLSAEEKKEIASFVINQWAEFADLKQQEGQSTFNINDNIYVKLTDKGFSHWQATYNEPYTGKFANNAQELEFFTKRADKDGYVKFQMWEFMRYFGDTIHFGNPILFNTNILFDKKDFK